MSSNLPISFYDIASNPPLRTFAANPWKIRLALNFKGALYRTEWVDMPDITAVREKLGVPANRTLPDGSPFHTLPVIEDASTGKVLGDSFEIALYLDEAYPDAPRLFRPYTTGLIATFNQHIDGLFTKYAILCSQMPFDPRCLDKVLAMFAKRANAMKVDLQLGPEQIEEKFVQFEADLGELAKAYKHTGGTTDYFWRAGGTEKTQSQRPPAGREEGGPFLDGDEPAYADIIVGAWLKMFETAMKPEDWKRVRSWQGGHWGRLVDALSKWAEIK
jgi:glutathione S-transferase